MKTEKGVIIAAYKQERHPRFVVLKREKNWEGWELPKGHLEDGDCEKTVRQELQEEAGIEREQILDIEDLDYVVEWTFEDEGEEIKREYNAFLVKLSENAIINVDGNPHDEHSQGFFFRKKDAESLLTYENNVEVVQKAFDRLQD